MLKFTGLLYKLVYSPYEANYRLRDGVGTPSVL